MSTTIRNKVEVKGGFVSGNYPGYMNIASPVAEYSETTITDYQSSSGVLGPNGKVYFIPGVNSGSTLITVIDPLTGDVERLACGSWLGYGAVLAPDGIIYCFPYGSVSTIMTIDPETHVVDTSHKTGVGGSSDYLGATLHPNGNIYLIPATATNVGVYDYATNTFSSTTSGLTGLAAGAAKWHGGCLASNGKIYCAPYNNNSVLIIDPATPSTDVSSIATLTTYAASSWRQGCLASTGLIYFSPMNGTSVLIVDPSADTADEATIAGITGTNKYCQGILAPNGKIYCLPITANHVLVVDPATNTTDVATYTGFSTADKYYGRILAPNGKIYAMGFDSAYAKYIELIPGGIPTLSMEHLLSPYRNNC